jgi:hypothetical protein
LIKKIVVIAVNSLDLDTYVENRKLLPALDAIGSQACMMHPPWKSNRAPQEICRHDDAVDYWKGKSLQLLFLRKKPREKAGKTKPTPTYSSLAGTLALVNAQSEEVAAKEKEPEETIESEEEA